MAKPAIQITGAKELRKAMKGAGREDLKAALKAAHLAIAKDIAGEAAKRAPRRSGNLARSVRGLGTATSARIAGGSKAVPYAGVVHYGWPAHNIAANSFVTDAVSDRMDEARASYEKAVDAITRALESD